MIEVTGDSLLTEAHSSEYHQVEGCTSSSHAPRLVAGGNAQMGHCFHYLLSRVRSFLEPLLVFRKALETGIVRDFQRFL